MNIDGLKRLHKSQNFLKNIQFNTHFSRPKKQIICHVQYIVKYKILRDMLKYKAKNHLNPICKRSMMNNSGIPQVQ